MNAELQKAIECLRIQDVYLRNSQGDLMEGFDPKYSPEANDLAVQFKHVVTRGEVLQLQEDEGEVNLFRVYIDLGARWVVSPESEVEGAERKEEENVRAVIEATFLAEYLIEGEPGQEALDAFALKNASYHVWPYWREYLMSQCMRMNLPKVALPAVQFSSNNRESVGDQD
jgi:hypothetical protein